MPKATAPSADFSGSASVLRNTLNVSFPHPPAGYEAWLFEVRKVNFSLLHKLPNLDRPLARDAKPFQFFRLQHDILALTLYS
jgi:hypothetical protein